MPTKINFLCIAFVIIYNTNGLTQTSDTYQRVMVLSANNDVNEIYFKPGSGEPIGLDLLKHIEPYFRIIGGGVLDQNIVAVSGYFAPNDGNQHGIVALKDGSINEIYFKSAKEINYRTIKTIRDEIVALAAYYAPTDDYQHVIVASKSGDVSEIFFKPGSDNAGMVLLKHINGEITSVSAYYAKNDNRQHVIVATKAGDIWEIFFKPGSGEPIGIGLLKHFEPTFRIIGGGILENRIISVSGYYATSDDYQHVIVALNDGRINEIFFKPGQGVSMGELKKLDQEIVSISAYYAASDGYQHVMVATKTNDISEIFFKPGSGNPIGMGLLKHLDTDIKNISGYDGVNADIDMDGIDDKIEQQLLSRFRPYYKFSNAGGEEDEHPTDALWFVQHSELFDQQTETGTPHYTIDQLRNDPSLILRAASIGPSDIRAKRETTNYYLNVFNEFRGGDQDWNHIISSAVGLYGHVAPLHEDLNHLLQITAYKIEYWQFYAHDNPGAGIGWLHEGDWEAVQLVVENDSHTIRTVIHNIHSIQARFDINQGKQRDIGNGFVEYVGPNSPKLSVDVHMYNDAAQNTLVRFYCENEECTHPVVYIEHGGHASWPTEYWSWPGVDNHNGDSYSYLVAVPPNLGEIGYPNSDCIGADLILHYNGHWGSYHGLFDSPPEGPTLKIWQWGR